MSCAGCSAPDDGDQATWPITDAQLPTPWTDEVTPDNALPEYPRPQLTRDRWANLNGLWEFAGAAEREAPPFGETLAEEILVPYPTESELSGIDRHEDHMWYRRTVEVLRSWRTAGQRVLLDFGAVDHTATVWVNRQEVAHHEAGYGRFSADVTDALTTSGPQKVLVGVTDRTDATWQPVGKQRNVPDRGSFYEAASGIWQTVWTEPVAGAHAEQLDMTTDIGTNALVLTVEGSEAADGSTVDVVVRRGDGSDGDRAEKGRVVARATGAVGEDGVHSWSLTVAPVARLRTASVPDTEVAELSRRADPRPSLAGHDDGGESPHRVAHRRLRSTVRWVSGLGSGLAVLRVEPVGLVLDMGGDVRIGGRVCTGVVAAEEQLAYGQNDTHVGLGAAAVAAVEGGERFGRQGRHISIQPFARAVHASPGGRFAASIAA